MKVDWKIESKNPEIKYAMYVNDVKTEYVVYQDFFDGLYYSYNLPKERGQTFKYLKW